MRIVTVAGTRPEAIKLAPLVSLLAARDGIVHQLVATGQHPQLFGETLQHFDLSADLDLALGGGQDLPRRLGLALPSVLNRLAPDLVIVQGDTSSAWAAAHVAARAGIAIAHVEAGLRSGDPLLPFPEERNRIEIDLLSTLLFAPNREAAANLRAEGIRGQVHVTGNTGIDALLATRARRHRAVHDPATKLVLVTCHRREAVGLPLLALATALIALAERLDIHIVLPLHPNPDIGRPLRTMLAGRSRITLTDPLPYPDMVWMMDQAHLLLTDSGGLQEEATALGLPTLVLRDNSERPEAIACGTARLVGLDTATIVAETTRLLDDAGLHAAMSRPAFPYGDGHASERILAAIEAWFDEADRSPSYEHKDFGRELRDSSLAMIGQ